MLTISQLALYAGVTVRAVRHYHAKGLLPEPERDHSGYRRYDAAAVVELVRIRTLADAGVPLSRVRELLVAGDEEFAAAVEYIYRRLRAEIRERQRHRKRIAQLAAGDSLALPPEAVAYLDRMRELGFRERLIEIERDSWILIAAQMPDETPALHGHQARADRAREVASALSTSGTSSTVVPTTRRGCPPSRTGWPHSSRQRPLRPKGWKSNTPSATTSSHCSTRRSSSPSRARRACSSFLEERGWTGWTDIRRVDTAT